MGQVGWSITPCLQIAGTTITAMRKKQWMPLGESVYSLQARSLTDKVRGPSPGFHSVPGSRVGGLKTQSPKEGERNTTHWGKPNLDVRYQVPDRSVLW